MASKTVHLRLMGGMFACPVKPTPATKKDDSDTKLENVCCGPSQAEVDIDAKDDSVPAADKRTRHAPIKPKMKVVCPTCGIEKSSWFGWEKGHANSDGSYTLPSAEALEEAKQIPDTLTKLIDLTEHDVDEVDSRTLRAGRVYYLEPAGPEAAATYPGMVGLVKRLTDKGKVLTCMYAPSTVPAMFRLAVIDGVLVFEEVASETMKLRPQIVLPEAAEANLAMLEMASGMAHAEFDPATYADKRIPLIQAAIRNGVAQSGGALTAESLAAVPATDPYAALKLMLGASAEPVVSVVPDTVAPKKRATSRKKATAEKIPA